MTTYSNSNEAIWQRYGSARAEAMDGAKRGGKRESAVLRTQRTTAAQAKVSRPHDRGR